MAEKIGVTVGARVSQQTTIVRYYGKHRRRINCKQSPQLSHVPKPAMITCLNHNDMSQRACGSRSSRCLTMLWPMATAGQVETSRCRN